MSQAVIFISSSLLIITNIGFCLQDKHFNTFLICAVELKNFRVEVIYLLLVFIANMQGLSRCLFILRTKAFLCAKKDHIITLSRQLLNNYRSFSPWKNIRLIHQLTISRYDSQAAAIEKTATWREDEAKIHEIINELGGQLHLVPHEEVNILLNILKERGYRYNSELPIFRGLNKVTKMLLGKQFKAELLPKTLFYMKVLKFPKLTTIKMLQEFLAVLDQAEKNEQNHFVSLTNLLRLVIISLEEPYIPFPIVKKLLESALKESANTLSSRCALYHIRVILPSALNAKIQYQATKANARSILFNPYSTSEEAADVEMQPQGENEEQSQYINQVKTQLSEMASQISNFFLDSLDIKKLEQMIVEGIRSDVEPFTKESLIYVSDILELRPHIQHYLRQNLESLTPVQLIYLAKRCKDIAQQQIKLYLDKLSCLMSLQETAYLLTQASKHFHYPVGAEVILKLIHDLAVIDYSSFMGIAKLTEVISKDQQGRVKEILAAVQSKMQANGQERSDRKCG